ncbi:MAG: hypothetical protein KAS71_18630 [Bacteroidales bacterium]|nr:hypothetical protein [Bacteroidales bacterium]
MKVLLLSAVLLIFAILGLSVKLLFDKKSEFKGGSCSAISPELEKKGISCGCDECAT